MRYTKFYDNRSLEDYIIYDRHYITSIRSRERIQQNIIRGCAHDDDEYKILYDESVLI